MPRRPRRPARARHGTCRTACICPPRAARRSLRISMRRHTRRQRLRHARRPRRPKPRRSAHISRHCCPRRRPSGHGPTTRFRRTATRLLPRRPMSTTTRYKQGLIRSMTRAGGPECPARRSQRGGWRGRSRSRLRPRLSHRHPHFPSPGRGRLAPTWVPRRQSNRCLRLRSPSFPSPAHRRRSLRRRPPGSLNHWHRYRRRHRRRHRPLQPLRPTPRRPDTSPACGGLIAATHHGRLPPLCTLLGYPLNT